MQEDLRERMKRNRQQGKGRDGGQEENANMVPLGGSGRGGRDNERRRDDDKDRRRDDERDRGRNDDRGRGGRDAEKDRGRGGRDARR